MDLCAVAAGPLVECFPGWARGYNWRLRWHQVWKDGWNQVHVQEVRGERVCCAWCRIGVGQAGHGGTQKQKSRWGKS